MAILSKEANSIEGAGGRRLWGWMYVFKKKHSCMRLCKPGEELEIEEYKHSGLRRGKNTKTQIDPRQNSG